MSAKENNSTKIVIIILAVLALLFILAGLLLPALAKAKSRSTRGGMRVFPAAALHQLELSPSPHFNTESYAHTTDNPFLQVRNNPLSTFSIDVDTASYANVRRFLNQNQLPPVDAVRIEEMLNYFSYQYPVPADEHPFAVHAELADCPWNSAHRLARIGLKAREIPTTARPACNLVFLIDVSGSMQPANKLPLLQRALGLLVEQLTENDRVAIVVYAGNAGLVLESTSGADKNAILRALNRLEAGGSTNGGEGIDRAYRTAIAHFIKGGANRVILCTDGDFNVGVSSPGDLTRLVQGNARSGVFLTVLGVGMGNYKDSTLERLADLGNGNYGYIDTLAEAKKLLVEQLSGTLVTVAKDVKIQVEFNPLQVNAYRLLGYENRMLRQEDFNDDSKDAGDIGSGHTVTALYEIVPAGTDIKVPPVDALKYQAAAALPTTPNPETMTIKLRYKLPESDVSAAMSMPVIDKGATLARASRDFKFAAAVSCFGMLLRDSEHKAASSFRLARALATDGSDGSQTREELRTLIDLARRLKAPGEAGPYASTATGKF